ncbi:hypothetical protein B0H63DRAFT_472774 [Podospora didyma]|uniref:NodB homology domain-containing protein n=1 Tax=Podospora didyma TaxID=330526 RepID=A0AAE0NPK4_9PEZI|nr:hypothetical protein B0H63DRAFT_472774 [Podospora didyma]
MDLPLPSSSPPWPGAAKAAVSITMDNLGEAQDVLNGTWGSRPIGTHPAVRDQLPRMLDLLARHNIHATYFTESWSLAVYPDAIADWQRRGHEVAWHGYQHEVWHKLSAEEEEENFAKSFAAAKEHGIAYKGFRPPGGTVHEGRTHALLSQHGVKYLSPLGDFGIGPEGIVVLPFEWRAVDAFYYMDKFAGIRKSHGESEAVLSPADFRAFLMARIDEVVRAGGYMSILFHPFLTTDDDKMVVMEDVLGRVAADPAIWCAPCDQVAEWVAGHSRNFGRKE